MSGRRGQLAHVEPYGFCTAGSVREQPLRACPLTPAASTAPSLYEKPPVNEV